MNNMNKENRDISEFISDVESRYTELMKDTSIDKSDKFMIVVDNFEWESNDVNVNDVFRYYLRRHNDEIMEHLNPYHYFEFVLSIGEINRMGIQTLVKGLLDSLKNISKPFWTSELKIKSFQFNSPTDGELRYSLY